MCIHVYKSSCLFLPKAARLADALSAACRDGKAKAALRLLEERRLHYLILCNVIH